MNGGIFKPVAHFLFCDSVAQLLLFPQVLETVTVPRMQGYKPWVKKSHHACLEGSRSLSLLRLCTDRQWWETSSQRKTHSSVFKDSKAINNTAELCLQEEGRASQLILGPAISRVLQQAGLRQNIQLPRWFTPQTLVFVFYNKWTSCSVIGQKIWHDKANVTSQRSHDWHVGLHMNWAMRHCIILVLI